MSILTASTRPGAMPGSAGVEGAVELGLEVVVVVLDGEAGAAVVAGDTGGVGAPEHPAIAAKTTIAMRPVHFALRRLTVAMAGGGHGNRRTRLGLIGVEP